MDTCLFCTNLGCTVCHSVDINAKVLCEWISVELDIPILLVTKGEKDLSRVFGGISKLF